MDFLDDRKRALRTEVNGRRPRPGAAVQVASEALVHRLLASGLLSGARTVGLYRSLPSEAQTADLALALEQSGARVVYPVVRSGALLAGAGDIHSVDSPSLQLANRSLAFRPDTGQMRRGPLGVEEPAQDGPAVPLAEIDLLILPGLAADAAGHRLGRGRGYYDATLAAAPHALAVMLLFESGLVPDVPVGEHDVEVDAVCTESRLLLCSARARERAARGSPEP